MGRGAAPRAWVVTFLAMVGAVAETARLACLALGREATRGQGAALGSLAWVGAGAEAVPHGVQEAAGVWESTDLGQAAVRGLRVVEDPVGVQEGERAATATVVVEA